MLHSGKNVRVGTLLFCLSSCSLGFIRFLCLLLQKVSRVSNKAGRSMDSRRPDPTSFFSSQLPAVWVRFVLCVCVWQQVAGVGGGILLSLTSLPRYFLHSPNSHSPLGLVIFQIKGKNILHIFGLSFHHIPFPKAFYSVHN